MIVHFLLALTITILILILLLYGATVKKSYQEPNVSATEAMQPLINGDRLREVLHENVFNLMSGPEGTFLPTDAETSLNMYSLA